MFYWGGIEDRGERGSERIVGDNCESPAKTRTSSDLLLGVAGREVRVAIQLGGEELGVWS